MSYSGATRKGSPREAEFVYDPKTDMLITFKEEKTRKQVVAWLLKNSIYGNMMNGLIKKNKHKWEIGLVTEECMGNLAKKCGKAVNEIENYECMKPLDTKVIFSSVPGNFPDAIIRKKLTERVGNVIKAHVERDRDDGIPTGRRFYWIKTADLDKNPITEKIKIGGRLMWTFYQNQPTLCFKCKKTGHIAADCNEEEERVKEDMIDAFEPKNYEDNENADKKRQRETTGLTPDGKKQANNMANLPALNAEGIDPHNENDLPWRMALDTVVPVGTTVPRGAGMKECCICNQHLVTGQTEGGLIIARCTCNNDTRANVLVKCVAKDCREWIQYPKHGARVICKCDCNIFVCKCNCLHTVPGTIVDYKCEDCDEQSDPPLNDNGRG